MSRFLSITLIGMVKECKCHLVIRFSNLVRDHQYALRSGEESPALAGTFQKSFPKPEQYKNIFSVHFPLPAAFTERAR